MSEIKDVRVISYTEEANHIVMYKNYEFDAIFNPNAIEHHRENLMIRNLADKEVDKVLTDVVLYLKKEQYDDLNHYTVIEHLRENYYEVFRTVETKPGLFLKVYGYGISQEIAFSNCKALVSALIEMYAE